MLIKSGLEVFPVSFSIKLKCNKFEEIASKTNASPFQNEYFSHKISNRSLEFKITTVRIRGCSSLNYCVIFQVCISQQCKWFPETIFHCRAQSFASLEPWNSWLLSRNTLLPESFTYSVALAVLKIERTRWKRGKFDDFTFSVTSEKKIPRWDHKWNNLKDTKWICILKRKFWEIN